MPAYLTHYRFAEQLKDAVSFPLSDRYYYWGA